jgi:hypothetical protein
MELLDEDGEKRGHMSGSSDAQSSVTNDSSTAPIFVVGCHRSGTTLLRFALDSHPRIACPPETKFLAGLGTLVAYPQALDGLAAMGVTRRELLDRLAEMTDDWYSRFARSNGKLRWADKTPNYFRCLYFIDALFRNRPLYIIIVRHPVDTVVSLSEFVSRWPTTDPDLRQASRSGRSMIEGMSLYWTEVTGTVRDFAETTTDRALFVHYESLVSSPAIELERVFTFIGEDTPSDIVSRTFKTQHASGYGDPKIRSTSGFHTDSVGSRRRLTASAQEAVWSIVGSTAASVGYFS